MSDEAVLARLAADRRANPIRYFQPRPHARPFFFDPHPVVFLFGGKRSSKSYSVVARTCIALSRIEPVGMRGCLDILDEAIGAERPIRVRHWCYKRSVAESILLPIYLRYLPRRMIDLRNGRDGYNRDDNALRLRDGSCVEFLTYRMEDMSGESAACDIVNFDEPPKESTYLSQFARIVTEGGFIWGAMTLDQRRAPHPIQWIDPRIRKREKPEYVNWYELSTQENVEMCAQEAGPERGEQIRGRFEMWRQIVSPAEAAMAIDGKPGWVMGLVYPAYRPAVHHSYDLAGPTKLEELARKGYGEIWVGLDHGMDHPTAALWVYVSRKPIERLRLAEDDLIAYREYKVRGLAAPQHILRIRMLGKNAPVKRYVADPHMWDADPKGGLSVAQLYITKGIRPLQRGHNPKRAGHERVAELLSMPPQGAYPSWPKFRMCKGLLRETENEFLSYMFKPESDHTGYSPDKTNDVNDDLMDALRYLVMAGPVRRAKPKPPFPLDTDPITGMPLDMLVPIIPGSRRVR